MGQPDKTRELFVCELVADEMNSQEETDYRALACDDRFPDVLLISSSGKFPTREAEVVSTPQDFTIRSDNKNTQKFERHLLAALEVLGVSGCDVLVNWHNDAIRFGMDKELIAALAKIIAAFAPSEGYRSVRGEEIYRYSPEVSRRVNYFRTYRAPSSRLDVHSSCGFWAPNDGSWIEEAVTKKATTYRDMTLCSKLLLVIDGLHHLDSEQMTAYRIGTPEDKIPFGELWAVTMGRAYRLKP